MRHWHAERLTALLVMALGGSAVSARLSAAEIAASPTADGCQDPVCLTAARLEADATRLILHDFDIVYATRGTTVTGDLAEGDSPGRDSKNTHWVLTGHVQITIPQGRLKADRATMQIVNGRISTMTAEGSPAEFDRGGDLTPLPGASPSTQAALGHAHGHARQIIYDLDHGQLDLSGDSYLANGCYEFTSDRMSYDIANQRVQADPHDGGGVRGRITRDRSTADCPGFGGGGGSNGPGARDKP